MKKISYRKRIASLAFGLFGAVFLVFAYVYHNKTEDFSNIITIQSGEQLLPEPVAETMEEAEEFLEDCMAVVCKNLKEVKAYFEDQGADIEGMSLKDLEEASEVFALPDGRYLIVEA